tara:strand:- start:105 stop:758 length:654 start_codon:yes stop_codon:yes gene_type:complete
MCFTKEMSLGFFLLGIGTSYYLKNKNLYIPIIYFSVMELLQYIGYITIENKNESFNKILAILIYIHIGFQPYFANLWFSNYIPSSSKKYIPLILNLCIVFGLFWISRLFFWDKSYKYLCDSNNEPGCGKETELAKGPMHLLYKAKVRASNYLTPSIFMHFFLWFIPIIFLGVDKFIYVIIFISGLSGWLLTSNIHEAASIWCLFLVPVLIISILYKK